ncbi:multicopper oxidase family protein, partial [Archangium sp.]|uniref:multicopper oxidase family protein n=1 Tax=Archangium sp. TaxID=1872627 RepID=UPI002D296370
GVGPAGCQQADPQGVVQFYESCDAYFQRLVDAGKLASFPKGAACVENFDLSFGPGQFGVAQPLLGDRTSINGQITPVITIRQGELNRWRLLHGGIRETLMLGLVSKSKESTQRSAAALVQGASQRLAFQVIAHDGIATGRMDEAAQIELQPGYRVDALVRIDQPGEYELIDLSTPKNTSLRGGTEDFQLLAQVRVLPSDAPPMALPDAAALAPLAPYKHVDDKEVTGCQYNTFKIDATSQPARFLINEQPYNPTADARTMPLGKAEEWVANSLPVTGAPAGAPPLNHPYHIHINSFELVDGYAGLPKGTWKDTILIRQDEPVRLRTRYTDFTGKFVLHCHILDHEDQGMMQLLEVLPKGAKPTSCPTLEQPAKGMCAFPPPPNGACPPANSASR